MMKFNKHQSWFFCLVLCIIIGVLFLTGAPMDGSFSWGDSPQHALNGAFIMDLFKDLPFDDPVGYAYNYYSQYPALTILFYPPIYSFILAPVVKDLIKIENKLSIIGRTVTSEEPN